MITCWNVDQPDHPWWYVLIFPKTTVTMGKTLVKLSSPVNLHYCMEVQLRPVSKILIKVSTEFGYKKRSVNLGCFVLWFNLVNRFISVSEIEKFEFFRLWAIEKKNILLASSWTLLQKSTKETHHEKYIMGSFLFLSFTLVACEALKF